MIPDWLLTELPTWPVFITLAAAVFGGCSLRAFSGFGGGLLMAPLFSLVMSPTNVLVLVLAISLATSFQVLPNAIRFVDWRLMMRLFIPSLFGLPIGLTLIQWISPDVMRKTVSFVVIVLALLMLSGWHYKGRRGLFQDAAAGVVSGMMTGLAGIGGPPLILYMLSDRSLTHAQMRALCIVYFTLGQISALIPLAIGGALTAEQGVLTLILLPIAIIASVVGSLMHFWAMGKRQALLRRTSLLTLLTIGIMAFLV